MANTVKVKRSAVAGRVPTTTDIALGELAINTTDGKLYLKKSVGGVESIVDVTAALGAGVVSFNTRTGAVTLNAADVNTALGYTAGRVPLLDGMKNFLINPKFQIWQSWANRVATSPATNQYVADGWIAINPAGTQYTMAGSGNYLIWQATVAGTYGQLHQPIESYLVRRMAGKQVTFSWEWGPSPEFVGSLTYEIYYSTTSDAWANTWLAIPGGVTGATTGGSESTYMTQGTFTVPANAVGLRVGIVPTNVQPTSAAVGIVNPQLELGPVRTAFENREFNLDLAMCQRYFEKSYPVDMAPGTTGQWNGSFWNVAINGGDFYSLGGFRFKAEKRVTPTVTLYDPYYGTAGYMSSPQDYAQTTAAVTSMSADGVSNVRCTPNNNMTTNRIYTYHYTANARL